MYTEKIAYKVSTLKLVKIRLLSERSNRLRDGVRYAVIITPRATIANVRAQVPRDLAISIELMLLTNQKKIVTAAAIPRARFCFKMSWAN